MTQTQLQPSVLIDSNRGVYIPKYFAQMVLDRSIILHGTIKGDMEYLAEFGPEGEAYWDTWEDALNGASIQFKADGPRYTLYHNDDLWVIPEGFEGEYPGP